MTEADAPRMLTWEQERARLAEILHVDYWTEGPAGPSLSCPLCGAAVVIRFFDLHVGWHLRSLS